MKAGKPGRVRLRRDFGEPGRAAQSSRARASTHSRAAALALVVAISTSVGAAADDWPGWRGDGTGVSAETKLPLAWDAKSGVAWSAELPGEGNSSPIVMRGRVYVTCSTDGGRGRHVLSLEAATGRVVWKTDLAAGRVAPTNPKTGYAPSTPCTDGRRVYAFFDSPGLVALDLAGKVLWTRDLGPFKTSWNLAACPVVCGKTVVMCCDHDGELHRRLRRRLGQGSLADAAGGGPAVLFARRLRAPRTPADRGERLPDYLV